MFGLGRKREDAGGGLELVGELVRQQKLLEAIKQYRRVTGCDLRQAKAAVDAMAGEIRGEVPPASDSDSALSEAGGLQDVAVLVRERRTVDAIKRYRELTGCDLREAKASVEAMARELSGAPQANPDRSEGLLDVSGLQEVEQLARRHQLIEAIKRYRALTGCDLREAKASVEAMVREIDGGPR